METLGNFSKQGKDTNIVLQMECSSANTFIVTTTGHVYSWGELSYALGRQTILEKDNLRPMRIEKLRDQKIIEIACGDHHVLALNYNADLYSWGDNTYGQLGLGDTISRYEPTRIDIKQVFKISAGSDFSFALMKKKSDGQDTFITFIWGNNSNIKLRKINDEEQKKSLNPVKVLQPAWGNYNPNITLVSNKRGKNYAYKSKTGKGVDFASMKGSDVFDISKENSHLKRKLQNLTKKLAGYEEAVYGADISLESKGMKIDDKLENILALVEDLCEKQKEITEKIEIFEKLLNESDTKIEETEKKLNNQIAKEKELRELIEKTEDDIKYPDPSLDGLQLSNLVKEVEKYNDAYTKYCEEKTILQKEILDQNEISKKISGEMKELAEKKADFINRIKIFSKIAEIRKKQLILNFFEQSRKGINKELDNFSSIYEAVNDAKIESLSKSLQKNSLSEYITTSEEMLNQLQKEVQILSKPVSLNFVFEELNKMWEIMDTHINLVKERNSLVIGLIQETAFEICSNDDHFDESAEKEQQREVMKKIIIKSNLNRFK